MGRPIREAGVFLTRGSAGYCSAKGANFDGAPYSETAHISIVSNTACVINGNTGGSTSEGIYMRDCDSLAAAYRVGDAVGLIIYKINDAACSTAIGQSRERPAPGQSR